MIPSNIRFLHALHNLVGKLTLLFTHLDDEKQ